MQRFWRSQRRYMPVLQSLNQALNAFLCQNSFSALYLIFKKKKKKSQVVACFVYWQNEFWCIQSILKLVFTCSLTSGLLDYPPPMPCFVASLVLLTNYKRILSNPNYPLNQLFKQAPLKTIPYTGTSVLTL